MAYCVNRSSKEFQALTEQSNINPIILAAKVSLWQEENGLDKFPTIEDIARSNVVNQTLKSVDILSNLTNKQKQEWNKWEKNNITSEQLVDRLQIPKEQKQIVLESLQNNKTPEQVTLDIVSKYGHTIEINTAKENLKLIVKQESITKEIFDSIEVEPIFDGDPESYSYIKEIPEAIYYATFNSEGEEYYTKSIKGEQYNNSTYYSNLTVPGGTNYSENEIAIPDQLITETPKGIETKQGVDFVFEQNTELASIGTQEQYSQYLDTIFPNSKVKDIVYHGTTNEKLISFETYTNEIIPNIVHFSKNIKDAEFFSEGIKVISAIINHNNPVISKEDFDNTSEENYNKLLEQGTFIGAGFEHVVRDKSKIHILGSKQDIEGFRKFIKNNTTTKTKKGIVPSIKGHAQFSTDNGIGWFRSDDKIITEKSVNKTAMDAFELEDEEESFIFKKVGVSKTRRILEVQSDLFQKGRDKTDLISKEESEDGYERGFTRGNKKYSFDTYTDEYWYVENNKSTFISKEEYEKAKSIRIDSKENKFLQLLNKDNNWVTFFVKSIIQDSAKKGYEKVLFPTGNTASKVEGHTTLEEFKKQKEDRLTFLNNSLESLKDKNSDTAEDIKYELEQLKQELETIEREGFGALKPIYNFYENTVTNILNKTYGKDNVNKITDEYGNTWNEITIDSSKHSQAVLFNVDGGTKTSNEVTEKVKQVAKKIGVDIIDLEKYAKSNPDINVKGVNGVADLTKKVIAVSLEREEEVLTEEIVHIATAIIEQTNPQLITSLISKIDRFKIYKQVFDKYKNLSAYQLPNGKPNIRKIKKEAVDKLIAEIIINQTEVSEEEKSLIEQWWQAIKDFIKGMYTNSNIDLFKGTASTILTGEFGTVDNIKEDGVYFQINENVKNNIDNLYDKYLEYDSQLKLVESSEETPRHYLYNDIKVAKSVTEKVKEKFKKTFTRTDAQKKEDDQKRDWGSEGHAFVENYIINNLIDENGYKRKQFGTTPIKSKLSAPIQNQLALFTRELINSYPEGTRFLIEKKVINTKVKGMLASTVDFKALYPHKKANGEEIMKVDTLDWKFTSINKDVTSDIPHFKQKEWVPQMGEYTQIDYNYGVKREQIGKARMIPFILNYGNKVANDKRTDIIPLSLEIGKLNSLQETNMYLLPVPSLSESTENKEIDNLIKSLDIYLKKLNNTPLLPGQHRLAKTEQLDQLSTAIRSLHVKLDFKPLINVAESFLHNAKRTIDFFEKLDINDVDNEEIKKGIHDLREYLNSANKFASMDAIFLSQYPKDTLDKEQKVVFNKLENITKHTLRMEDKIMDLLRQYTVAYGVRQEITTDSNKMSILNPEVQISTFVKTWAEGTRLPSKIIKLASNMILNASSIVNRKTSKQIEDFGKLIIPLEQLAKSKGVKAFDLIGKITPSGLQLIKKIDPKFFEEMSEAKDNKDSRFFLKNMDRSKFKQLAEKYIKENSETIDNIIYSEDEETNNNIKNFRKKTLINSVDIFKEGFNGYNNYAFNKLFMEAINEKDHYSSEYKTMASNESALKVWEFFMDLNKKGKDIGYLSDKSTSFFPLIEATTLEKFGQTSDLYAQGVDTFKGLFLSNINENQTFSKIDPETGKVKKIIPKYFTSTDKNVNQLSTDLNKVGALWIKALLDYENSVKMEDTLQTFLAVEKSKGSLRLDENGRIIFDDSGRPIEEQENNNAKILETIVDDFLYHLQEDLGSLGNIGISTLTEKLSKTEEGKANATVNLKKTIKNADTLTRALAVGLKPLIAIANWAGGNFQSYINAGGLYTFWKDFTVNNAKVTSNNLSLIEKALLHSMVPLDDIVTEERRKIAKKQGIISYLSTWSFSDVMMSTNAFPEKRLALANALSIIDNSMVKDGKIVNIRQYLKEQDRTNKYSLSASERKNLEKTFEDRVDEIKKQYSLTKTAKLDNDGLSIPGVSEEELAKLRTKITEYNRKLNGQMSENNKAGYRRDTILSSFMMFKTWIPKLLAERTSDITKNVEIGEWEYGRVRVFFKTLSYLGIRNVAKMREIISGSEEGLRILDQIFEDKVAEHYRKTGQHLEITKEEFYDLIRKELSNEMKELQLLLLMSATLFAAAAAKPPEDASDLEKNRYKFWAKMTNKIADEITFYYNPLSFESMTKGSVLPSLNLITKIERIFIQLNKEFGDEPDKAYPQKAVFNVIPGLSQFQTEILPFINPELAKEWGIRVSAESRRQ